jgi:hypothetical protein
MQLPSLTGKVIGQAASAPLNLAVLGGAVVVAAALASWPVVALGGLAYAALIAADLRNPEFRARALLARPEPARMPELDQIQDIVLRHTAERIVDARAEIDHVLASIPRSVKRHVTSALASLDQLERQAALLVQRADALHRYLATADAHKRRGEADALTTRAQATADPTARASYQAAADAALRAVAALHDIALARARAQAQLERIAVTIKALPTQLVRLRALDDQASDTLSGDVSAELDRMTLELQTFEQSLESITEVTV